MRFQIVPHTLKIQEFTLVIVLVVFSKNDNLGLRLKILEFLGTQPTYGSGGRGLCNIDSVFFVQGLPNLLTRDLVAPNYT